MEFLYLIAGVAGLWLGTELTIGGALAIAKRHRLSEFFVGETLDPSEPSVSGLRIYLDLGYPDATWRIAMATSGSTSFSKFGNEWTVASSSYGDEDPGADRRALRNSRQKDSPSKECRPGA